MPPHLSEGATCMVTATPSLSASEGHPLPPSTTWPQAPALEAAPSGLVRKLVSELGCELAAPGSKGAPSLLQPQCQHGVCTGTHSGCSVPMS